MAVQLISQTAMNFVVSHLGEVKDAVHAKAEERASLSKAKLAAHRETGAAQVTVSQGDVDSFINLDDPAALSIEFGHFVGGKFKTATPKYVPGLYILTGV